MPFYDDIRGLDPIEPPDEEDEECRYCADTGWFYGDEALGPCVCIDQEEEPKDGPRKA